MILRFVIVLYWNFLYNIDALKCMQYDTPLFVSFKNVKRDWIFYWILIFVYIFISKNIKTAIVFEFHQFYAFPILNDTLKLNEHSNM